MAFAGLPVLSPAQALERLQDSTREFADRLERQSKTLKPSEAGRPRSGEREPDDPWVILEMHLSGFGRSSRLTIGVRCGRPVIRGFLALRRTLRNWRVRADWYSDSSY